jgi:SAM-dependent methyltransferase
MLMNPARTAADGYWDNYYSSTDVPELPSQFAVFAAGELPAKAVVDLGCGNGRDSLFFARRNVPVLGVDASHAAIENCTALAEAGKLQHASFICSDIAAPDLRGRIEQRLTGLSGDLLLYSRFFLHAINEEGQAALLSMAGELLRKRTGWLALEFRTPEDEQRQKVTPAHYRRYVPMDQVIEAGRRRGLDILYSVQGLGMAKYRTDDAYVARIVFSMGRR